MIACPFILQSHYETDCFGIQQTSWWRCWEVLLKYVERQLRFPITTVIFVKHVSSLWMNVLKRILSLKWTGCHSNNFIFLPCSTNSVISALLHCYSRQAYKCEHLQSWHFSGLKRIPAMLNNVPHFPSAICFSSALHCFLSVCVFVFSIFFSFNKCL